MGYSLITASHIPDNVTNYIFVMYMPPLMNLKSKRKEIFDFTIYLKLSEECLVISCLVDICEVNKWIYHKELFWMLNKIPQMFISIFGYLAEYHNRFLSSVIISLKDKQWPRNRKIGELLSHTKRGDDLKYLWKILWTSLQARKTTLKWFKNKHSLINNPTFLSCFWCGYYLVTLKINEEFRYFLYL